MFDLILLDYFDLLNDLQRICLIVVGDQIHPPKGTCAQCSHLLQIRNGDVSVFVIKLCASSARAAILTGLLLWLLAQLPDGAQVANESSANKKSCKRSRLSGLLNSLSLQLEYLSARRICIDTRLSHVRIHQRLLSEVVAALTLGHNLLLLGVVLLLDGHRAAAYDEELIAHLALTHNAAASFIKFLQYKDIPHQF